MPVPIKIVFSLVVLAAGIAGFFFLKSLGQDISPYLSLFLGAFAVFSFWIFPEVVNKK